MKFDEEFENLKRLQEHCKDAFRAYYNTVSELEKKVLAECIKQGMFRGTRWYMRDYRTLVWDKSSSREKLPDDLNRLFELERSHSTKSIHHNLLLNNHKILCSVGKYKARISWNDVLTKDELLKVLEYYGIDTIDDYAIEKGIKRKTEELVGIRTIQRVKKKLKQK